MSLPDPDRSTRSLTRGVLVFRWIALAWMTVLALVNSSDLERPALGWIAIGLAGAWTVWQTVDPEMEGHTPTLAADLAIGCALVLVSGYVMTPASVVGGSPFFATVYPASAALSWGVARGARDGAGAGLLLGISVALSRPINGVSFASLTTSEWQSIASGIVLYAVAGLAVGLVSGLVKESAEGTRRATLEAIRQSERAARLAERESIARHIHDSVLQALAMIHKRGRELASARRMDRAALESLALLAADQENSLRAHIMREPEEIPGDALSLRDAIEEVSRAVNGLKVEVSTVGSLLVEAQAAEEIAAAVRQLLQNVANHAGVDRATVFADVDDGRLSVTVRDDGSGFEYRPDELRNRGKAGLLKSVIGRIEGLGGRVNVRTSPGSGTLVELNLPVRGG